MLFLKFESIRNSYRFRMIFLTKEAQKGCDHKHKAAFNSLAALQGKTKPGNGCNHSQPGKQHFDREREMECVATSSE